MRYLIPLLLIAAVAFAQGDDLNNLDQGQCIIYITYDALW